MGTPGILAIHSSIVAMPWAESLPLTNPVLIPYVPVGVAAARNSRAAGKPIAAMVRDPADGTPFSRAQVSRATDHGHPFPETGRPAMVPEGIVIRPQAPR